MGGISSVRGFLLGSAIAVVGSVAGSATAHAGVPECGGVYLDAAASCELVVRAACDAECALDNLVAMCAADLAAACEASCDLDASIECTDDCGPVCEQRCQNGEDVVCADGCFEECTVACPDQCADAEDGATWSRA